MEPDLRAIHDVLVAIAQRAGGMITSARPSLHAIDTKMNSADLVTETDKAVEQMVSLSLKERYPDYAFMGEETWQPGTRLSEQPTFICDPIDGTTNFIHAYPYVSISLALVVARRPVVGVVYNPFTGHLYHAIRGAGAFLTTALPASAATAATAASADGKPVTEVTRQLPLRSTATEPLALNRALVAVEWGSERAGPNWDCKLATFAALAGAPSSEPSSVPTSAPSAQTARRSSSGGAMVHGLRSYGSAALNLCSVAAGELDAYWEGGCYAWDVAAGWVVLVEAGGMVVGGNAGEWEPAVDGRRYLAVRAAGSEEEQKRFINEFWACVRGRLEYPI